MSISTSFRQARLCARRLGPVVAGSAGTGLVVLWALSADLRATSSLELTQVPIADVIAQDAMVTGTVRKLGENLVLFSGSRLQSIEQPLTINFQQNRTLTLCPHSDLQVLRSHADSGIMLAFQNGGPQEPFAMRGDDVVLTPDWRVEMQGAGPGDLALLRLAVSPRGGDLCLHGQTQPGEHFHVTELVGDGSYDVEGGSAMRIVHGRMENSPTDCGCDVASLNAPPNSPLIAPTAIESPAILTHAGPGQTVIGSADPPAAGLVLSTNLSPTGEALTSTATSAGRTNASPGATAAPKKQGSKDAVGYLRSWLHFLFGR